MTELKGNGVQGVTNSHILFGQFDYYEPGTVAEACALLAQMGERARVLAGGTDLLVHMKMERAAPQAVISLGRIPDLDRIEVTDEGLWLGARTTIRTIEQTPFVQKHFQALAEACGSFSSTQVQTMGTIGGNLANASPASDSAPALIAFGAEIELAGPQSVRRLPLEKFFLGPGKPDLQPGEIVVRVMLPPVSKDVSSAFLKLGRVANDIAKASCAVVIERAGDRIVDCRLAFGSVGPTPMRAQRAEALLRGQVWSDELVDEAAALAGQEVTPIDDVRSTARYRREIVQVMAGDGLRRAWQRSSSVSEPSGLRRTNKQENVDAADHKLQPRIHGLSAFPSPLPAGEKRMIELRINGKRRKVWVASHDLLLNVLREDLQLTGTKYGCGIGECSACTVLLDGQPVLACLVLAVAAAGHDVLTIEGLAGPDGELDPLQEAFLDYAAYQCGYCTPGMLLTAKRLLTEKPQPTEDDVRHYLRGNLCRCTGYASIVRAVLAAAERETLKVES
jgi:xanthine dehydrogenase iron-sulfur cluster and FAD-binding subunit A